MHWLWREKQDGRRAPGYFLYLLGASAAVGAIVLLHRRAEGEAPPPHRRATAGPAAEVGAITQSAALMAPVKLPKKKDSAETRSYRLRSAEKSAAEAPPAAPPLAADSFNAISAALAGPGAGDSASDAIAPKGGSSPHYAALPPAFPPDPPRPARGAAADPPASLSKPLEYRDPQADAGPSVARSAAVRAPAALLPRGTLIAVYLLTTVDTANPAAVLQFGVAEDVRWNHRRQIPFGTRLLGKLEGRPMRDRLDLVVDTVLYPGGLELPIAASAVEADETGANILPGIAAEYFPPPRWVQVAPYLSDAVTGFMGLLQSRAQQQLSVGVGGVSVQTSAPDEVRAPLYQAGIQGIQDFTAARLKEVEQRYASHYLIPAGTACWLQLAADLDLSAAHPERAESAPRALPLSGTPSSRASDNDSIP